jgi:hypothetical protein
MKKIKNKLNTYHSSLLWRGLGRGICFFLFTFFMGCTEDINLKVLGGEKKIVIEGIIEDGQPAKVSVTHNNPLSEAINFNNILVTNAKVYVSNGLITDTLHLTIDSSTAIPIVYKGSTVIGMPNQTYYLTVVAEGATYTALTTIPAPVALDSVWWKIEPPKDSLGFAWAHFSEPAGFGNAYRWFAKRGIKDRRYLAPYGATFDDKFIDGKSFDFAYNRGTDPTATATAPPPTDAGYFKETDTIYIKFCSIDYTTCQFYKTYEAALQTNGNPFASPVSIISNIHGGALGVWGGFGCTYDTIMPHH